MFTVDEVIGYQTESLQTLSAFAKDFNVIIIYESIATSRDSVENIKKILELNPEIDFQADLGHLNLFGQDPAACVVAFKDRLSYVHLRDNDGQTDLHLPMGVGIIQWENLIKTLKRCYDGTITLEIFVQDRDYVALVKKKPREIWDKL